LEPALFCCEWAPPPIGFPVLWIRRVSAIKRIPTPGKSPAGAPANKAARDAAAAALTPRLAELARSLGDELIGVAFVNEPGGAVLRVTIDRAGGADGPPGRSRVTLADCEAFHRALIPLVESVAYDTLEVESPGADRPIATDADWARAVGSDIEISLYRAEQGAKRWRGRLLSVDGGSVAIDSPKGPRVLPRRAIAVARPWIPMDSLDLADLAEAEPQGGDYTQDDDSDRG
jgi:ribosome maturation factor RimP